VDVMRIGTRIRVCDMALGAFTVSNSANPQLGSRSWGFRFRSIGRCLWGYLKGEVTWGEVHIGCYPQVYMLSTNKSPHSTHKYLYGILCRYSIIPLVYGIL
jgi:hypothetical protein